MALIKAFAGALGGTFADQWLDIITVGQFGEHVALMPGVYQETNQGRAAPSPISGSTSSRSANSANMWRSCRASTRKRIKGVVRTPSIPPPSSPTARASMFLRTRPRSSSTSRASKASSPSPAGTNTVPAAPKACSRATASANPSSVRLVNASSTAANQWRTSASPS